MTSTPTPTPTDPTYDPATATPTYGTGAGPLTTVFQTPDFCASSVWENPMTPPLYSTICMPPRFNDYWNWQIGYYSPGICPSGYSSACDFPTSLASFSVYTDTESGTALPKSWPYYGGDVKPGETARLCCPTGYNCYSSGLMGQGWSYSLCISTVPSTTLRDPEQTAATAYTTIENLAYAIQVRWREQDLSILQTNPTVPGLTNMPTPTATQTAQATDAAPRNGTNAASGPGSLSNGLVQVAVGVSFGAFLLLLLAAFCVRRLVKRRKMPPAGQDAPKADAPAEKVGSSADTVYTTLSTASYSPNPVSPMTDAGARSIKGAAAAAAGPAAEIDSSPVAEMDTGALAAAELAGDATKPVELAAHERPVEIQSRDVIAELPGDVPAGSWAGGAGAADRESFRVHDLKKPGEDWNWI